MTPRGESVARSGIEVVADTSQRLVVIATLHEKQAKLLILSSF